MKKLLLLILLLALCLTSCGASDAVPGGEENPPPERAAVQTGAPEDAPEVHTLSEGGNVLDHEFAGYCGNTVTTVTGPDGEPFSFWGDDSVALTDLLRYLDYREGVCRCMPEYTVDTEFNKGYGVSLAEGYARYDGRQTALTAEQVEQIQGIIGRQSQGDTPASIRE